MIRKFFFLALTLLIGACAHVPTYPDSWWAPVDPKLAKSWEILPQFVSQKDNQVILSKRNELGLLSNFADTPFVFEGKSYKSLEGFWQMMKFPENKDLRLKLKGLVWPHTREQVSQMEGYPAKKAGSFASKIMKKYKINWVTYRGTKMIYRERGNSPFYQLIRKAMVEKLKQNPKVKKVLLATGNLKLMADHRQGRGVPKAWRYYEIWMELRKELREKR